MLLPALGGQSDADGLQGGWTPLSACSSSSTIRQSLHEVHNQWATNASEDKRQSGYHILVHPRVFWPHSMTYICFSHLAFGDTLPTGKTVLRSSSGVPCKGDGCPSGGRMAHSSQGRHNRIVLLHISQASSSVLSPIGPCCLVKGLFSHSVFRYLFL